MQYEEETMSGEATYIHEIREREINYDWMRVFAMSMVILNHIADWYLLRMAEPSRLVYLCEGLSRCAIPLFLMLTGAFVVDKAAKETPKIFYLKFWMRRSRSTWLWHLT